MISNSMPTANSHGAERRRKLGFTRARISIAMVPRIMRTTVRHTVAIFCPEALYRTTRPNAEISASPMTSGPSILSADSIRAVPVRVRRARDSEVISS